MFGNLQNCLAITLRFEGGRVDNPADPGGRTNEGVTQRVYTSWLRSEGRPNADVYDISPADRDAIYDRLYWTPAGCNTLGPGLDMMQFDAAVNSGVGAARRWLGMANVRASDTAGRIRAYADARLSFLHGLRTWRTFGRGWGARVATCEADALRMALGSGTAADAALAAHARQSTAKARKTRIGAVVPTLGPVVIAASRAVPKLLPKAAHLPNHILTVALAVLMALGFIATAFMLLRASHHAARAAAITPVPGA